MMIILDLFFNLLNEYIVYNTLIYMEKECDLTKINLQFYSSKFKFFSQT